MSRQPVQRTLTAAEALERAALLDVASYDVHLVLDEGETFDSRTTVRFRSGQGRTFLELDGELLEGDVDGHRLTQEGCRLPLDLEAGDHVATVVARCHTTRDGVGLVRSVDPADGATYVYGQSFLDDAQRIFACFDQPDLKARFTLVVDAPPSWVVRANTTATVSAGGHHEFASSEPMPPYLFSLAGGPWHGVTADHDGTELGVWCRSSLAHALEADEIVETTKAAFDFQQPLFGRPMPWGRTYDQVFVPDFNAGAMENAALVTFSDDLFVRQGRSTQGERRLRAQVIAHELAHMWFGNLVTMRWWDDLWLNEAFAEFMGLHTVAEATPYDGVWADFALARKAWGYRADSLPTTHPIAGPVTDTRAALLNFDGISYAKGASALRQLAAWIGEDTFFAGVRLYLARHAWGNTSLADLLDALETASGRDLGGWSQSWLRTSGTSTLRVVGGGLRSDDDRPHLVGVGRYDGTPLRLVERVDVELPARHRSPVIAPADLVLPNDGDLTFANVRLDGRSLTTARASLHTLDDPLARSLVWGSLWSAARDAELSAFDLVEIVLANLDGETDSDLVEALASQARIAAVIWAGSDSLERRLHEHHLAAAQEGPGSDLQLVHFRGALLTAPGRLELPVGLSWDEELRWIQLRRLATLGHVDLDELRSAYDAAPTNAALGHLAHAEASLPDAARKAAVWAELSGEGELTNHRGRSLAAGFWKPGQDDLLASYVDRYVDDAPLIWRRRSPELAAVLTGAAYPSTLVAQWVVDRTGQLTTEDADPGLRRVVLEQRDDLVRAVASRAMF